eukprot:2477410-Prymnesium_polylepis.1
MGRGTTSGRKAKSGAHHSCRVHARGKARGESGVALQPRGPGSSCTQRLGRGERQFGHKGCEGGPSGVSYGAGRACSLLAHTAASSAPLTRGASALSRALRPLCSWAAGGAISAAAGRAP